MPTLSPALLGPPLGVGASAAALTLLLRDSHLAASMQGNFLDAMVSFFAASCSSSAGLLVSCVLVGLFVTTTVLVVLEAGRCGAAGPVRLYVLFLALFQLVGVGMATPAVWLPAYAWQRSRRPTDVQVVTRCRVAAAGLGTALIALNTFSMALLPVTQRAWCIHAVAFQFFPALVYVPTRRATAADGPAGSRAAAALYSQIGGASAAVFWLGCVFAAREGVHALKRSMNGAVSFLIVDMLGLLLALMLFIRIEEGAWRPTLRPLLAAPLLSPGYTFAAYLARREEKFAAAADDRREKAA